MLVKYNVMQNQTQIINWLIENVGKYNCGWSWVQPISTDYFIQIDNEKDAIAFLLRWSEE